MTEETKQAIEKAFEFMRKCMAAGEDMLAHAFVTNKKGTELIAFANDCMETSASKNNVAAMLLEKTIIDCNDGGIVVFVSDTWKSKCPPEIITPDKFEEWRSTMPASMGDWPKEYVTESLIATANQIGQKGIYAAQPYTRTDDHKPVFAEIEYPDTGDALNNRFLFDLSKIDGTIESIANFLLSELAKRKWKRS